MVDDALLGTLDKTLGVYEAWNEAEVLPTGDTQQGKGKLENRAL